MRNRIVTQLAKITLDTPLGGLDIRLELITSRRTLRPTIDPSWPADDINRKLQASISYAVGTEYYSSADVSAIFDNLPSRPDELVATDLVADLIEGVVEGLLEKARIQGTLTGKAALGPPTHLTAGNLEDILRDLRPERGVSGGEVSPT